MKKLMMLLAAWTVFLPLHLQDSKAQGSAAKADLQERYWWYRHRLQDFMVIGEEVGQSISATKRGRDNNGNSLSYGDATSHHGWYLGVLATEYALLENNPNTTNEELQATLTELFFALETINRLDEDAEAMFTQPGTGFPPFTGNSMNGFFVRNDVPDDFLSLPVGAPISNGQFMNSTETGPGPAVSGDVSGAESEMWIDLGPGQDPLANLAGGTEEDDACYGGFFNTEMSQDQYIHLTLGLALTVRSLPNQNIWLQDAGLNYNFRQSAIDIWDRLLTWIATPPPGDTELDCTLQEDIQDQLGLNVTTIDDLLSPSLSANDVQTIVEDIIGLNVNFPWAPQGNLTFSPTNLDHFLIHNPTTNTLVHRGNMAWAYAYPMVQGFEEITGQTASVSPTVIAWSKPLYQDLYAFPTTDDNDAMASVLGAVCDCWGVHTPTRITVVSNGWHPGNPLVSAFNIDPDWRQWGALYLSVYNYLHDPNLPVIGNLVLAPYMNAANTQIFNELFVAPCNGPAYYGPTDDNGDNQGMALDQHRNDNYFGMPGQAFNSNQGGWAGDTRYYKNEAHQFRLPPDMEDRSTGYMPGMGFMLAHNLYLLNVDNSAAEEYQSLYRNRINHVTDEAFPFTYSNGGPSYTTGNAADPEEIVAMESIVASNILDGTADATVNYNAGRFIDLEPGFHADQGVNSIAQIVDFDCDMDFTPAPVFSIGQESNTPLRAQQIQTAIADGVYVHENNVISQGWTTGAEELVEESQDDMISVFPNPTSGLVELTVEKQISYTIHDGVGRMVSNGTFGLGRNTIDLSELESGIYFLTLKSDVEQTVRIVKQ